MKGYLQFNTNVNEMNYMLLIEQIFLIGINEKSNKISFDYDDYLYYGAILMDLVSRKKISLSKGDLNIEILNKDSTDEVILDKMLDLINTSERNTFLDICFLFLKKSNKSDFREVLISKLESLEVIKFLGKKRFSRRYEVTEPALKTKILDEINAVLFDNQDPTKELFSLLSLLRIESNFLKIVPKKLKKKAKNRILELVQHESIGNALQDYIDELKEEMEEALDDAWDDD